MKSAKNVDSPTYYHTGNVAFKAGVMYKNYKMRFESFWDEIESQGVDKGSKHVVEHQRKYVLITGALNTHNAQLFREGGLLSHIL